MQAERILIILAVAAVASLAGCTPITAGQLVQAGYDAAKTSLTSAPASQQAQHVRTVMNSVNVGDKTASVLASIGIPPKEKSGNLQGYTCYQYAAVYSPTEDAVIVSKDDKVVFYGNSTCRAEMQDANFRDGGKYAGSASTGASSGAPGGAASGGANTVPSASSKTGTVPDSSAGTSSGADAGAAASSSQGSVPGSSTTPAQAPASGPNPSPGADSASTPHPSSQ